MWIEHTLPLLPVVVAVSDDEGEALAVEYGLTYVRTENRPLGAKHNAAMALARVLEQLLLFYRRRPKQQQRSRQPKRGTWS